MKNTLGKNVRDKKDYVSVSDRNGFVYNCADLVRQKEYRGDSLVWTGLMVGGDELDEPQEQLRPFKAAKEGILPKDYRPPYVQNLYISPYNPPDDPGSFVCPPIPSPLVPYYGG